MTGIASRTAGSVDRDELDRFTRLAERWWDPAGEFRPLHKLNPVRLAFVRDRLLAHFGRDGRAVRPFAGLTLLDIGCGGGLMSEPMARLGFAVTAIDASTETVAAAARHAAVVGLAIDYRATTAEALHRTGARFDVALALEIVEHVADTRLFLAAAAGLVRPGGALVAATINRTAKAYMLAIIGAEYVLGWLPRGTHRWGKFLRPSELAAGLRAHGLAITDLAGVAYDPLRDAWRLGGDLDVNYLLFATKPPDTYCVVARNRGRFPAAVGSMRAACIPDLPSGKRSLRPGVRRGGRQHGVSMTTFQPAGAERLAGKIKWFNRSKGFGFIIPNDGSADIFLPLAVLERSGFGEVPDGAAVVVECVQGPKGRAATQIVELDASTATPRTMRESRPGAREDALLVAEPLDGVVKWYDPARGFGFVLPSDGGKDIFVHVTALRRSGLDGLEPGQPVRMQVSQARRGREASMIEILHQSNA